MIRKLPKEHRGKGRSRIAVPVTYTDLSCVSDKKEEGACKATTADLSNNGLGIFSGKEMKPGTLLEIECEDMWETPRQFTVKWCDKVQLNFYRLGLEAKK